MKLKEGNVVLITYEQDGKEVETFLIIKPSDVAGYIQMQACKRLFCNYDTNECVVVQFYESGELSIIDYHFPKIVNHNKIHSPKTVCFVGILNGMDFNVMIDNIKSIKTDLPDIDWSDINE